MVSPKNVLHSKSPIYTVVILLFLFCSCQNNASKQDYKSIGQLKHQISLDSLDSKALKLAYTGNMGVCIELGNKTVIIDGLHQYYNKAYVYPPEDMVNQLITGHFKDFSPIEFCLYTHLHGDHFSGKYAKRFLEHNSSGVVIGSSQLKKDVVKTNSSTDSLVNRFYAVPYDKQPHTFEKSGIKITAIRCDHTNPQRHNQTENIAYVVNLDNYSILHVGDTDWRLTREPFKTLDIKNKNIDLAVLPYWLLLDDNDISMVNELIAPKHIIATHIPPDFSKTDQKKLRERFTNITLLMELGEVHYFEE